MHYVWEVPGPWVNGGYMASICTMNFDNDNWLWQIWQLTTTVTMTKDSKKDSKINLMLKLHCIWYSKEFCQNCIYSLPVN